MIITGFGFGYTLLAKSTDHGTNYSIETVAKASVPGREPRDDATSPRLHPAPIHSKRAPPAAAQAMHQPIKDGTPGAAGATGGPRRRTDTLRGAVAALRDDPALRGPV